MPHRLSLLKKKKSFLVIMCVCEYVCLCVCVCVWRRDRRGNAASALQMLFRINQLTAEQQQVAVLGGSKCTLPHFKGSQSACGELVDPPPHAPHAPRPPRKTRKREPAAAEGEIHTTQPRNQQAAAWRPAEGHFSRSPAIKWPTGQLAKN